MEQTVIQQNNLNHGKKIKSANLLTAFISLAVVVVLMIYYCLHINDAGRFALLTLIAFVVPMGIYTFAESLFHVSAKAGMIITAATAFAIACLNIIELQLRGAEYFQYLYLYLIINVLPLLAIIPMSCLLIYLHKNRDKMSVISTNNRAVHFASESGDFVFRFDGKIIKRIASTILAIAVAIALISIYVMGFAYYCNISHLAFDLIAGLIFYTLPSIILTYAHNKYFGYSLFRSGIIAFSVCMFLTSVSTMNGLTEMIEELYITPIGIIIQIIIVLAAIGATLLYTKIMMRAKAKT